MQAMLTLVTFAAAIPVPLVTVQTSAAGWVSTVTLNGWPLVTEFVKVKLVAFALTVRLLPLLSCKTRPEPVSPVTVPPMV